MGDVTIRILQKALADTNRSIDLYVDQVQYCEYELKVAKEDLAKREQERVDILATLERLGV